MERYAAGFAALDLKPGERIGIWAPNCWEWVVTQFASARAGLILVNINPAYRLGELTYALETTGCAALIATRQFKTSNYLDMLRELIPELADAKPGQLVSARFPDLRLMLLLGDEEETGFTRFETIPDIAGKTHLEQIETLQDRLQFDDPINIQFTSGTTGTPKASTLTHHNIVNNAYFVGLQMKLSEADRMCIPVPMYHCFGMVLGTLCCVAFGSAMVFSSTGFDAAEVLRTVDAECCTVLHGGADHVHCRTGGARIQATQADFVAHGDHGRRTMSGGTDAAGDGRDASHRDHHCLRHDGNRPGEFPDVGG